MKKLKLQPTLNAKIEENSAWCASFDLVWQEFQNKMLENNFIYNNENQMIVDLVEEAKKSITLNDKDYYTKADKCVVRVKKEIQKAVKKKFKTKCDILNNIKFEEDDNTNMFIIYSIVMFALKFPEEYEAYKQKMKFGKANDMTKYFGIEHTKGKNIDKLYKQVKPLFYNSDNDFAVSLDSKDSKKIYLFRTDELITFQEAYKQILEKSNNDEEIVVSRLAIPNLSVDALSLYNELVGEIFIRKSDKQDFIIGQVMQNLKLELNSKGAKIKSEAVMKVKGAYNPNWQRKRSFMFNDTFYLFIVDNDNPIVALRVNDINLFNKK